MEVIRDLDEVNCFSISPLPKFDVLSLHFSQLHLFIIFHRCLQSIIEGCGTTFNVYIDQELLDLIFCSLNHTNRFVRETGYYVCGALVSCNTAASGLNVTLFSVHQRICKTFEDCCVEYTFNIYL